MTNWSRVRRFFLFLVRPSCQVICFAHSKLSNSRKYFKSTSSKGFGVEYMNACSCEIIWRHSAKSYERVKTTLWFTIFMNITNIPGVTSVLWKSPQAVSKISKILVYRIVMYNQLLEYLWKIEFNFFYGEMSKSHIVENLLVCLGFILGEHSRSKIHSLDRAVTFRILFYDEVPTSPNFEIPPCSMWIKRRRITVLTTRIVIR